MAHRAAYDRRLPARREHEGGNGKPAALKRRRALAALLFAATAGGCAQTWDAENWARSRAELVGRDLGRLGDATPYLFAADDTLVLFLCRWRVDAPLRASLPPDATPGERELLARALRAWEGAVPGLRFEISERRPALRLRFRSDAPEGARTASECRVVAPSLGDTQLRAQLVRADIELRRVEGDAWGRPVALGAAELLGSAAHEIGHALGHQGHARRGGSVMVRDVDAVRQIGRRLEAGLPLDEPALVALYAVPSGTRVGLRRLRAGSTTAVDALAERARERGRRSLTIRIGDHAARVRWGHDPDLVYHLMEPGEIIRNQLEFEQALSLGSAPGPGPALLPGPGS